MTAASGNIILSPGSLVSVAGSAPASYTLVGDDGTVSRMTSAGQAGSLSFQASGQVQLNGNLLGQAGMEGLPGGTLSVATTGTTLSVSASDLGRFRDGGFDAVSLSSAGQLSLSNPAGLGQVSFGRSLTLNALSIAGSDQLFLSAPWVQVTNTNASMSTLPSAASPAPGNAGITLSGTWLDVTGDVLFSGFNRVNLEASRDIRVTDALYSVAGRPTWSGYLRTSGDLTLQAARIYPTTLSRFTIEADGRLAGGQVVPGKVTILPSGTPPDGSIFSAGGSLTIIAGTLPVGAGQSLQTGGGIEQDGFIAAPLGSISLRATAPGGRVYLAGESVTTTRGSDVPVVYGIIQEAQDTVTLGDNIWAIADKANPAATIPFAAVQNAPAKSISLTAANGEVIVRDGAIVDVSGAGAVFATRFVPSYSGSNNPLAGSYVIVPDGSVTLPGSGVYLSGIKGLPAGTYSLLPAVDANGNPTAYVYMPGAMVLTNLGTTIASSTQAFTSDGYPIVSGYATTMGTGIRSPQPLAYEVRPASVVLAQGEFETQTSQAGAAGSVTVTGNTTILNGAILADPLPGYSGGSIALSGNNIAVQASIVALPSDFAFSTPVPSGLAGTLNVAAPSLSGQGFQTIGLGVSSLSGSAASVAASTVEIKPGVTLQAENIVLGAATGITLDAGAQVLATALPGDTGQVTFISPAGTLNIGANVLVHASNSVNLQAANTVIDPTATLKADHSSVNLQGNAITIYDPATASQTSGAGLFLTKGQWDNLSAIFENITLTSLSDLVFEGSFAAGSLAAVANTLTIDAGRIMDSVANSSVFLSAQTIGLQNTTGAARGASPAAAGSQITFSASQVQAAQGNTLFDGFSNVNLSGRSNVTFSGVGSLTTASGNLTISTPRIATTYYLAPAGTDPSTGATLPAIYTAANYAINAGAGTVTMRGNGAASASTAAPGGTLRITAGEIDVSTIVEVPSGQVELTATGNVNLGGGGQLLSRGTAYAPGGVVSLTSTGGGAVTLSGGSLIDVSAGSQGDAGTINLYAPIGGVSLNGSIQGQSSGGKGGSFSLATNNLDTASGINGFSALNNSLAASGFNETISIEASTGNITIAAADKVQAHNLTITADGTNPDGTSNGGSIILDGAIGVNQPGQGGTIGIYAHKDLIIDPTGYIDARGTGTAAAPNATGGDVTLAVDTGMLTLAGGTLDVSGSGTGAGGTVTFRDPPPPPSGGGGAQSNMSLSGTVRGASSVVAEIDKVYVNQYQTINSTAITKIQSDLTSLMAADAGLATQLPEGLTDGNGNHLTAYNASSNPTGTFHLRPGAVIEQTAGDGSITLGTNWDLTSLRYSGEPGTLTLRAAGNLNINANLIDNPTNDYYSLRSDTAQPSWGINLVAGANTASPNLLAVIPATSAQQASQMTLTVSSAKAPIVVYTESGPIRFASGGDTVINTGPWNGYMIFPWMQYTLATYAGTIRGDVKGSLTIGTGGVIQSATGDIDLHVGGTLSLLSNAGSSLGTIRTTGEHGVGMADDGTPYDCFSYFSYGGGGSISLNVGGDVQGGLNPNAWLMSSDFNSPLSPNYYPLVPAYDLYSSGKWVATQGIAAMAGGNVSIRTGGTFNTQTGTFGEGNLQVYAGGDLKGRFLVEQGTGVLNAMGNFGTPTQKILGVVQSQPQLIEMADARISVSAQGNVEIGAVLNPGLAGAAAMIYWDNGYTPDASIALTAATGDVNISGAVDSARYGRLYSTSGTTRNTFLPPSVAISAGRDIKVSRGQNPYYMQLPSPSAGLSMEAGRDIVFSGGAIWFMSDADPSQVYVPLALRSVTSSENILESHAAVPVHTGDPTPATITAGRDIIDASLNLPKMAAITAGRDIVDLNYTGQNISAGDVTTIAAAGNMVFGYTAGAAYEAIQVGGPGFVLVQAGGTIDLGASNGIQTIGNAANQALSETGSSLVVAAGFAGDLTAQGVSGFFDSLRSAGVQYSALQAAGDSAGAAAAVSQARSSIIAPFLGSANAGKDITMTSSQISTTGGGSLFIVATGALNVGTTVLGSGSTASKSTGILTETGGSIDVFANGDVNVNEARMMTFQGGDITVWSDKGSINAGKGSKTAVNASLPTYSCINGVCSVKFAPPQVGSGIRAVTYAPDENTPAPPPGDIYLFAPQGVIDAGEAGISGGKVFLGAVTVLNVANISFTAGSVGVPSAAQTVSLGALTGSTNLSDKTIVSQDSGALGSARGASTGSTRAIEDMVKWFDVKFISFDLTSPVAGGEGDEGRR